MTDQQLYSLNYFNRVGKVELCRLIFAAADIPYDDNFIEKITDKDVQIGYMPYLNIAQKTIIPCISVICRHLARELELDGKTSIDKAMCDAIAQNCMLLIDAFYRNVNDVEDADSKKCGLKNYFDNDVENTAGIVEKLIEQYCKKDQFVKGQVICNGHCVGGALTYADLFVYEMVSKYFPCDSDTLPSKYPNLYKVKAHIESLPAISKFRKENKHQREPLSRDVINDISKE